MTRNAWDRWPVAKSFIKPGDEIEGRFLTLDPSSEKYPIINIRTADGLVRIVRVTQTRLHERLVELDPKEGDRILIRYDGEAPRSAPGMSRVKQFTVEVTRAGKNPAA